MKNNITIGSLIENEVRKQQMSITEFADKICNERQNAYRIFKKNDISLEQLRIISKALNHNFFDDLAKDPDLAKPVEIQEEELTRLQALDQFLEFVPKAFEKLGYDVALVKPTKGEDVKDIPLPDYILNDFNITFTEGLTYKEKCGDFFHGGMQFYDYSNEKAKMVGYINYVNGLQGFDIAIELKNEEEWLEIIKSALEIIDVFYLPKTWFSIHKLHNKKIINPYCYDYN